MPTLHDQIISLEEKRLNDINKAQTNELATSLESGKVIYFPKLTFIPKKEEYAIISEKMLAPKRKNISYDYRRDRLSGIAEQAIPLSGPELMRSFMRSFAEYSKQLIVQSAPEYREKLVWGRTSFRPAEIKGRTSSPRKDDTRLHVDSFPATPVNGYRILRVFCNINPDGIKRAWNLGEPFSQVLDKFSPSIPAYSPIKAKILKWFKVTKTLRSPYDHYMINLHDDMKLDCEYQQSVQKQHFEFESLSTWVVFTDYVSHAALSGQHLLEQTFYLPISAMENPDLSPLKLWQNKRNDVSFDPKMKFMDLNID